MFFCSETLRSRKLIGSTSITRIYRPSVVSMMPFLISLTGIKSSALGGCFFLEGLEVCFEVRFAGCLGFLRRLRFWGFCLMRIPNCSGGVCCAAAGFALGGLDSSSGAGTSERYRVLRWMSHLSQLTTNSDRESPSKPTTAKIPSGSEIRQRRMIRVVSERGNLIMGKPDSKTSTQASIALRARIMPPNKRPLVRKFGGI